MKAAQPRKNRVSARAGTPGHRPRPSAAADVCPPSPASAQDEPDCILSIQNRQRTQPINAAFLRQILQSVLANHLQVPAWELCLHLVGAREMATINQGFLQHEGSTDVITFDHSDQPPTAPVAPGIRPLHGEIYISVPDAVAQAREFHTTWNEEVVRYALHGVLHLLGHDDLQPNARRFMKRAENRLVAAVAKTHPLAQLRRQRRS